MQLNILAYLELNVFAFAILLFIYMDVHSKSQKYLYEQKVFLIILTLNAVLLVLDTLQWLLNGRPGITLRVVSIIIAVVYCAITPLPCFFWSIYSDYQIFRDEKRIKKLFSLMAIPLLINFVFALLSAFYGLSFVIDQNNVYHRGIFFYLITVICYYYLVYSIVSIFRNRKLVEKKVYISLLLFALPPFIGGIIQSLFYGVSIIWACTAFSIMIIFINIQNNQSYTDDLTKLYNRRQFNNYMREWVQNGKSSSVLGIIMIDLDSFKKINDSWGHLSGDTALVETGKILKSNFRNEDLICRYGGDEFIIVLKVEKMNDLIDAVKRLKESVEKFNKRKKFPYSINFSIGFDIFDRKSGMTVQQFMRHVDHLMYVDKKQKKSIKF
ncbi:GGDEF domain-containing protein [Clostridium sp. AWRP]|uniref:GGDEF domain-containing protein n=1 Tax=Clostridium sp. AWRP TaxID=2212991 RepID=UPI000FDC1F73|nr:GGDEF domain-containing protein [Clostridium sp. AWRP]AZV58861.1 diguanylate cyclase [Clostridium sp. AWRP]